MAAPALPVLLVFLHGFDVWYLNIFHLYDARDARMDSCVFCSCSLTLDFQITVLTEVPQIALSMNMNMDLYEAVLGRERRNGTDCLVGPRFVSSEKE